MSTPDNRERERKVVALRLYADGLTSEQVATRLSVNRHTVRRWASEAGVKRGLTRQEPSGLSPRQAKAKEPVTHYVIPDTQCKPGVNLDHLYWAGRYAAEQGYSKIIHLGDHYDMPSLSSYESKGSKYFEGRRYIADVAAGNKGMDLFIEGLESNGRRLSEYDLDFLLGNHEDRITRAINADPKLEGLISLDALALVEHGWKVHDFLVPVKIGGILYSHYFYNPYSGRAYSGSVETMLRNVGTSFSMGHQQGLRFGRRELANGQVQIGLVAGSFYSHEEDYKGPQGNRHWRGVAVKHEVKNGAYDPMFVSIGYLKRKFR